MYANFEFNHMDIKLLIYSYYSSKISNTFFLILIFSLVLKYQISNVEFYCEIDILKNISLLKKTSTNFSRLACIAPRDISIRFSVSAQKSDGSRINIFI